MGLELTPPYRKMHFQYTINSYTYLSGMYHYIVYYNHCLVYKTILELFALTIALK